MNTLLLWEQRNLVICFSPFEQAVKLSNTYACRPIWDLNLRLSDLKSDALPTELIGRLTI